ncbi:hypothetical protein J6590_000609 [Homalodisca vitripennis]|nr:hypothetical protein J6590_000609 [Homalodisca vitripennis]
MSMQHTVRKQRREERKYEVTGCAEAVHDDHHSLWWRRPEDYLRRVLYIQY